jgi:hypothetical protein
MDPLSTTASILSILQFVQCGAQLFSRAVEIYKSPNGSLASTDTIEQYARGVLNSITQIRDSHSHTSSPGLVEELGSLLEDCSAIASQILKHIDKMKTKPGGGKISSLRKALRSMVSGGDVESLLKRLQLVREAVQL